MQTCSYVACYRGAVGHGVDGREPPPAVLDAEGAMAVAETLQALTAPSRLLILAQLRQGPAGVGALARGAGLEQSAASHQLRLLKMMGLVTATRSGRAVTYALYDGHVAALLDQAVWHAEHVRLGHAEAASAQAPGERV